MSVAENVAIVKEINNEINENNELNEINQLSI
jgi:hypothetical protein